MTMKVLLIGGIAIASAMPANAQDLPRPEVPEQRAGPSGGIRIAEASNGFQLVEHGFWQSEQAAPAPSSSVAENGRVNLPYRYEPKAKTAPDRVPRGGVAGGGPRSFRRQSEPIMRQVQPTA